ncbi:hypothetical protein N9937_00970 [bacterium]|nr:hypothetical protein [bacterium]
MKAKEPPCRVVEHSCYGKDTYYTVEYKKWGFWWKYNKVSSSNYGTYDEYHAWSSTTKNKGIAFSAKQRYIDHHMKTKSRWTRRNLGE